MLKNNYEGILSSEEVSKIEESCFPGLKCSDIEINRGIDKGGNLGDYAAMIITSEESKKCFFIKMLAEDEEIKDYLNRTGFFQREVNMYKTVLHKLQQIADEKNIRVWPQCYLSKETAIVLEDLVVSGYKTIPKKEVFDEKHLRVAIKSMSSMHALSIIMEEREGNKLNTIYSEMLEDLIFTENKPENPVRTWLMENVKDFQVGVDYLNSYTQDQKILIKKKLPKIFMRSYFLANSKDQSFGNAILHGDLWGNNILFKYGQDNQPIECRLVDYQFSRYGPPANDLLQLLHMATKKSFRDKRENEMYQFYYNELGSRLADFGYEINHFFSWDTFMESCKYFKLLALIKASLGLHSVFAPCLVTSRDEESRKSYMKEYFADNLYVNRVVEVLRELIDDYIFKNDNLKL